MQTLVHCQCNQVVETKRKGITFLAKCFIAHFLTLLPLAKRASQKRQGRFLLFFTFLTHSKTLKH